MSIYLLAHDLGTSANKATLFDTEGNLIKSRQKSYPAVYSNETWAEQNPEDWWQAVCLSTKEILQGINASDIAAVSFSGQMMGVVPVDHQQNPLRTSIIWADMRATVQADELAKKIGMKKFYSVTGHRLSSSYSLEKLMWIRDNQNDLYAKIYKTLCAKDYIILKLTGNFVTDASDASGTNAFDLNTFKWSEEILDAAGIPLNKFPEILESTSVAGKVSEKASKECGLLAGTPVVTGGGDGMCASIGAGSIEPGITYNCLGSSSWIATVTKKPILDDNMILFNWAHIVPGYIGPCGTMQAAAASFNWAVNDLLGLEEPDKYKRVDTMLKESGIGAKGLLYLPYLLGERSPRWNPNARGVFIGLNMDTQKQDILRAVVEGVALNLKVILDAMTSKVSIDKMILIGGLAQSPVIRGIIADVFGMNTEKPALPGESTSLGAAVTAGVGIGALDGFSAIHKFCSYEAQEAFNKDNHREYQEISELFNEAYASLITLFDKMAARGKPRP
jgi:xylulokinase